MREHTEEDITHFNSLPPKARVPNTLIAVVDECDTLKISLSHVNGLIRKSTKDKGSKNYTDMVASKKRLDGKHSKLKNKLDAYMFGKIELEELMDTYNEVVRQD